MLSIGNTRNVYLEITFNSQNNIQNNEDKYKSLNEFFLRTKKIRKYVIDKEI